LAKHAKPSTRRSAPASKTKAPAASRGRKARPQAAGAAPRKVAYGHEPGFPISMAVRAGDFIFTSAQGDHGFDPADVVYDERGLVVSDGSALPPRSVGEETRGVLRNIEATLKLAGCTLDDVVDASVWLRDPRDFPAMNVAYAEFFKRDCPTRSIFRVDFMFDCRVEIKVTAYKPLTTAARGARSGSRKASPAGRRTRKR
jgi:2-iminobutanoate/2-iminopropanoate deaminase